MRKALKYAWSFLRGVLLLGLLLVAVMEAIIISYQGEALVERDGTIAALTHFARELDAQVAYQDKQIEEMKTAMASRHERWVEARQNEVAGEKAIASIPPVTAKQIWDGAASDMSSKGTACVASVGQTGKLAVDKAVQLVGKLKFW